MIKKLIIISAVFFWASLAMGENVKTLICDPQAGVTNYKITWADGREEIVEAEPDGSISYDLVVFPVGMTSGEYRAGRPWTLDGVPQEAIEWSPPVPFVLGRPAVPQLPMNTGLKQTSEEVE